MFDSLLVSLVIVSCIEEARVQWVVYLHLDVVVLVLVAVLLDVVDLWSRTSERVLPRKSWEAAHP